MGLIRVRFDQRARKLPALILVSEQSTIITWGGGLPVKNSPRYYRPAGFLLSSGSITLHSAKPAQGFRSRGIVQNVPVAEKHHPQQKNSIPHDAAVPKRVKPGFPQAKRSSRSITTTLSLLASAAEDAPRPDSRERPTHNAQRIPAFPFSAVFAVTQRKPLEHCQK